MGLIGSIVGGATSLVGGVLGARAANKGYNDAIDAYNRRMQQVKAHRDALYYQDPTQTAENQAAVTEARELLDEQAKQVAAKNIVSGGTDESVALQKAAGIATVGKMLQEQAVQGAAKKENIWNTADQTINEMNNYIATTKMNKGLSKAKAITDAASGLANTANKLPW